MWAREWKFKEAIRDYDWAEKYGVKMDVLYWKRGESYRKMNLDKDNDANRGRNHLIASLLSDYAKAEALGYPNDAVEEEAVKVYLKRISLHRSLQQYEIATKDFTQVIRRQEKNGSAYFDRNDCYRKIGMYHLAAADF